MTGQYATLFVYKYVILCKEDIIKIYLDLRGVISLQKLRVQEKDQEPGQEEQAESDQESEGSADMYGPLDASRPKKFSADEDDKGKEAKDDDDEGDDDPLSRSPDVDINQVC